MEDEDKILDDIDKANASSDLVDAFKEPFESDNLSKSMFEALPGVFDDPTFGDLNRTVVGGAVDALDLGLRTIESGVKGGATAINEAKNYITGQDDDRLKRDLINFFVTAGVGGATSGSMRMQKGISELAKQGKKEDVAKVILSESDAFKNDNLKTVMSMTAKRQPSLVSQNVSFNDLRKDATIRIDNPAGKDIFTGETYVEKKIRQNKEFMERNPSAGPVGLYEGITGRADNVKFNPKELQGIKGEMGEDAFRMTGDADTGMYNKLKGLEEKIKKEGYKPTNIKITVTEDGTPYITEGNHRLAEALKSDRPFITADINYLRGGESVDGLLNPTNIGIGGGEKQTISVFPKPERMFPKGEAPKGGDYLNPATGEVITGKNVQSANIKINPNGRPDFKVSDDNVDNVGTVGKGNSQILTNLFKRFSQKPKDGTLRSPDAKGNWQWTKTPEGFDKVETVISVTHKGKHFYTIETDFTKGVNLKKYPNQKDEPKLRPTVVGQIELGQPIGEILVRGNPHKVYDKIKTFNRGGLMARN